VRLILDGTVVDVRLDPLIGAIVLDEMRARWWRYLWSAFRLRGAACGPVG